MNCKLTQMIEDVLENDKKMEDFIVVIKGKQYDIHVKRIRSFFNRKFKQLRIHVIESRLLE